MAASNSESILSSVLEQATVLHASDVHFACGRYPTVRIDGKMTPLADLPLLDADLTRAIGGELMNEEQKKKLTDRGHVDFSYSFRDKARFRTNVFIQRGNVSITMRYVTTAVRSLEELNVPKALYNFCSMSQGLVLVTGPIGHGKSTTLAALIDYINHNFDKHIITIEDPIEYMYEQDRCIINQREIGQDAKSFGDALQAVFREDANVVLIGEMRDLETIGTALTAAETGHLIFGTLHTNDAAQTVDRIIDVFPAHQQNQVRIQLASVLAGVISQRLIPKIGGGRIPAIEILINNSAVENLIRENKSYQIDTVIETNLREGMISLDKSLAGLVKKGLITADDAFSYAKNRDYLQMLIKRA